MGNYYFVNYFCKFRAIYFKSVVGRTGNAMSRPTPGLCAHDKLPLQAWLGKRWENRRKSGGKAVGNWKMTPGQPVEMHSANEARPKARETSKQDTQKGNIGSCGNSVWMQPICQYADCCRLSLYLFFLLFFHSPLCFISDPLIAKICFAFIRRANDK